MKRFGLLCVAAIAVASAADPASAALMRATLTGLTFGTYNPAGQAGAFGLPGGSSLDGLRATVEVLFDPDRVAPGLRETTAERDVAQGFGGGWNGMDAPSPIETFDITIGGHRERIFGLTNGFAAAARTGTVGAFSLLARDFEESASLYSTRRGGIEYAGRGAAAALFSASLDAEIPAFGPTPGLQAIMAFDFAYCTGRDFSCASGIGTGAGFQQFVDGYVGLESFAVERAAPAPVPLPATLPLLLGALGGLASLARRNRRAAARQVRGKPLPRHGDFDCIRGERWARVAAEPGDGR